MVRHAVMSNGCVYIAHLSEIKPSVSSNQSNVSMGVVSVQEHPKRHEARGSSTLEGILMLQRG